MKKKSDVPPAPLTDWVEEEPQPFPGDENAEVVKLQVGQSVEGEIVGLVDSKKWAGHRVIKIKEAGSDHVNVILGTTMLDRKMSGKKIGDIVKITRMPDQPSDKGNNLQVYKVFKPRGA